MPGKRRKTHQAPPVAVTAPDEAPSGFSTEAEQLAFDLFTACLENNSAKAMELVGKGADAWVQSGEGWTALHAAASVGDAQLVEFLMRKGNAVWNVTDNVGMTAGDIAWSLNESEVYELLLAEGVRSEMLRAVMASLANGADDEEAEEEEVAEGEEPKRSTASDNATFLASKLIFSTDETGQEVCRDAEGNGVMMGWERGIMKETAERLCSHRGGQATEDDFSVVNVGFGLGIIDEFLQSYSPTSHLIIEPHPDVLAHARSKGWFDRPGVRFYEGTWQNYLVDIESGKEEYPAFDAIYFDTYSEHYADLHAFFDLLPNILRSPDSRFSFFHGLGATSRLLYDVYTTVSELHLLDIGLKTEWSEVDLVDNLTTWDSVERRYWGEVGPYRLPICRLEILIQNFPVLVLTLIFQELTLLPRSEMDVGSDLEEDDTELISRTEHGGNLIRWNSNGHLAHTVRGVCRGWEDAAIFVQYRRIAVIGLDAANAFLRTCSDYPHLALKVRSLVVGRGVVRYHDSSEQLAQTAPKALSVVSACLNLEQLFVHPLPPDVREVFLQTLQGTRVRSLVCTPLPHRGGRWCSSGFVAQDMYAIALPSLEELELDFVADPRIVLPPVVSRNSFHRLQLVRARLDVDLPSPYLVELLTAARATLVQLDFYTESPTTTYEALLPSLSTMRRLRFITNPSDAAGVTEIRVPQPAFDRLLPFYDKLESLSVTSHEISARALRFLPPCLKTLEVCTLAEDTDRHFVPSPNVLDALRDPKQAFFLKQLVVRDDGETWTEEYVELVEEACEARGIAFRFLAMGTDWHAEY